MDRDAWNERYRSKDLVWGSEPNRFVAEALGHREPAGRALDLACGEGRNAIWLAKRGWSVTGVDLSDVAIERARKLADAARTEIGRGSTLDVEFIVADATTFEPEPGAFALVVVSYLQVPKRDRERALARAASALAPGGELFMIGHALRNLAEGSGGPRHPSVLWDPGELASEVGSLGLRVERCEEVLRPVETETGLREAIDTLLAARLASPSPA